MQRLEVAREEEGAVAVFVAVTLVVLLGMAALVLDVGNLYWERRQLQNGADAAALAAAQDLADGSGGTAYETARRFADANNSRGAYVRPASHAEPGFVVSGNSVTVTARTGAFDAEGVLSSILVGVVGVDDYATSATATASWGAASSANTVPLTFSSCEWETFTGLDLGASQAEIEAALPTVVQVIYHHTSSVSEVNDCDGPAGQDTSGGFGWLEEDGPCAAVVENGEVEASTGAAMSQDCQDIFDTLIGQTVLMPIFVEVTGSGTNSIYDIGGFAAFEFVGYRFPGEQSSPAPCGPPETCLSGRFVEYYDLGAQPASGGSFDLGAYVVGLTG